MSAFSPWNSSMSRVLVADSLGITWSPGPLCPGILPPASEFAHFSGPVPETLFGKLTLNSWAPASRHREAEGTTWAFTSFPGHPLPRAALYGIKAQPYCLLGEENPRCSLYPKALLHDQAHSKILPEVASLPVWLPLVTYVFFLRAFP